MSAAEEVVAVRAIAAGGDGVASLADGRTLFIPRTAPGDRVRLRNVRLRSRFARAEIAEIVEAGAGRVVPPCPHYLADQCGGCQLMHLDAATQRAVKGTIAGDAIRRIGRRDAENPVVVPATQQFDYRTKITFTSQQGRLGYHHVGDANHVFSVRECLVAHPELRRLHAALRAGRDAIPADDARVVLRLDRAGQLHVIVATPTGNAWTGGKALHSALQRGGVEAVVWWHPEGGKPRAVAGASDPWPATVFEQVNPQMGRLVRAHALEQLGNVSGTHVWDLYAGIGETTVELLQRGATVTSVESDPRAVEVAERLGPVGPRRMTGLVEGVIDTLDAPGAVVTNPPRTGMSERITQHLGRSGAARIVYISCDAATLARDIQRIGPAYTLTALQAFDQFPQTAHLESVAVLELA